LFVEEMPSVRSMMSWRMTKAVLEAESQSAVEHQGKRDAARDLLAPVYGWFTQGFGTRDLKEANALLQELAE
jgi:predicted ATPase